MKKAISLLLLIVASQLIPVNKIFADPGIRISKASWNIGKVPAGEVLTQELVIENSGDETLKLKVRQSCECISISFTKKDIKPGKRHKLIINFDTTSEIGQKTSYLFLDSNDPVYPNLTWMIESEIMPQGAETIKVVPGSPDAVGTVYLFSTPRCKYCLKLKKKIIF